MHVQGLLNSSDMASMDWFNVECPSNVITALDQHCGCLRFFFFFGGGGEERFSCSGEILILNPM